MVQKTYFEASLLVVINLVVSEFGANTHLRLLLLSLCDISGGWRLHLLFSLTTQLSEDLMLGLKASEVRCNTP